MRARRAVAEALATLLEMHRAGDIVLSGWRCSWDRWGGKRETDGRRQDIPVPEAVDLCWDWAPELGRDDFVLVRRDSYFDRTTFRPENFPTQRNHGWTAIGVTDAAVSTRSKEEDARSSAQPGPNLGASAPPSLPSEPRAQAQADAGGGAGARKTKRAPVSAAMVEWRDALPPNQRKKTPNALANQYFEEPGRRGSFRQACSVFANPDKYRGRS